MSGALKKNADEMLDAIREAAEKIRRAYDRRTSDMSGKSRRDAEAVRELDDMLRRMSDDVRAGRQPDLPQRSSPDDVPTPSPRDRDRLDDIANGPDGPIERLPDGTYRMRDPQSPDPFERNPNHDAAEFDRQVQMQQDGMNRQSAQQFFDNRDRYELEKRTDSDIQRIYRDLLKDLGFDLDGQAVLHGPDQVAGGFPHRFDGHGDAGVNSSLGAQWKDRIASLEESIADAVSPIPDDLLDYIRINVSL